DRLEPRAVPRGEHRRHVAAVAAAEHADPVGIAELEPGERLVEHGDHVVEVDRTPTGTGGDGMQWPADRLPPRRVPATPTAWVGHDDDEPGSCLHLGFVEEVLAVLGEGPAVHVEQD